jgi:hypothetical protein
MAESCPGWVDDCDWQPGYLLIETRGFPSLPHDRFGFFNGLDCWGKC